MSNKIVGELYQDIIEGVIREIRLDFEDSGVDETTLQELKQIWQQKLSSLAVADFPWDAPQSPQPTSGLLSGGDLGSNGNASNSNNVSANTNGISAGSAPAQVVGGLVLPGGGQIAQTDGPLAHLLTTSSSIKNTTKENDTDSDTSKTPSRIEADNILQEKLLKSSQQQSDIEIDIPPHLLRRIKRQQADGALGDDDDEDENDSDGINSDLDDPDDNQDSGSDDDDMENGMMMLCLYDKVQRVKTKWKYILKDGVANINGKDYVFNKSTGESEW